MRIRKDNKIKVITGKDKGKTGKVLKVFTAKNKVLVEGVNIVKRHIKPGTVSKEGGIINIERPINVSNVMLVEEKSNIPVRVGYKVIDSKKYRISKKSGEVLEK